ncbi:MULTISPECIES: porin [Cupriavidus]|uniref:porin n=1 Tax=Cupriavidus TaxID=106589 RepID=UPI000E10C6C8|nr:MULTISPECIES: porin [Cupriavidus]MBP0623203.1 porin [Cupriavidus sp. LEh25]MDK2659896.1 porin [Cupriavidus sp. LEh21]SOY61670.1 Porin [Cupriavidus taiwanensis]SOY63102.1 Porin [Cupriavidus taiwanensis]SOY98163.1 Porin [Cupriavidus taiwanensis]
MKQMLATGHRVMSMSMLCLLSTLAVPASAQSSVTLYGLVDTNIEFSNHNAVDGKSAASGLANAYRMNSGGMNSSRWGIRGKEDLGGGLKSIFTLESGIDTDTGNSSDGRLFGRLAFVGIESRYGQLALGRQTSSMYDLVLPHDPMGYAPQYSWVSSTGSAPSTGYKTRLDNTVKYTGVFGPVTTVAHYSLGEQVGNGNASAAFGGGLRYDGGPASFGVVFDQGNGAPTASGTYSKARDITASGSYSFGAFSVLGGYRWYELIPVTGGSARSDLWWAGVRYAVTPALRLTGAVYYEDKKDTASDPMLFVLQAVYSLSKRTSLYSTVGYAYAKTNNDGTFTPVGVMRAGDRTPVASNQTGVTLGIQHRF